MIHTLWPQKVRLGVVSGLAAVQFVAPATDLQETLAEGYTVSICLGLFKVICYFPTGKSTIWGIYSEYVFFFDPLSKSKYIL